MTFDQHFYSKNSLARFLRYAGRLTTLWLFKIEEYTMKNTVGAALLLSLSLPALAADCIYFKDADRLGERMEQTAPAQSYELKNGFSDVISSVWIRDGYYALLTQDFRFKGAKIYLYGA